MKETSIIIVSTSGQSIMKVYYARQNDTLYEI